ncbi:hypothetical protein ACIGXM_14225 [Kitasatospora sp. NPDC052896]|uniref:hypothetical protein n=1 Tax=Kitasatospora sp. NPDC052896 TaxID=3364061 RepID=UPI0037CA1E28
MTGLRHVTIGVIGTGTANGALIHDALCDHFDLGPADEEGCYAPSARYEIRPVLPVGERYETESLIEVWDWAMRADLHFTALHDETVGERTQDILDSVLEPEDVRTVSGIAEELIETLAGAENPLLLVLSAEGELDDEAQEVAAGALQAGIPVLDLSRALLELDWRDLPNHSAPAEIAEDTGGQLGLVLDPGPEVTLTAQDVQAVQQALTITDSLLGLITTDVLAYANEVSRAVLAARAALAPKPEPVEKRPGKAHLEVFDPETGTWKPAGRGRPRKGVQTRLVPHN